MITGLSLVNTKFEGWIFCVVDTLLLIASKPVTCSPTWYRLAGRAVNSFDGLQPEGWISFIPNLVKIIFHHDGCFVGHILIVEAIVGSDKKKQHPGSFRMLLFVLLLRCWNGCSQ
jgi:hypothetical protein